MGNVNGKKIKTEAETVADIVSRTGLRGELVACALRLAYLEGNRAGYHEAAEAGGKRLDRVFDRLGKATRKAVSK